jgi:hypothetical protein
MQQPSDRRLHPVCASVRYSSGDKKMFALTFKAQMRAIVNQNSKIQIIFLSLSLRYFYKEKISLYFCVMVVEISELGPVRQ